MQTTLRINDAIYRSAKSDAARRGMTMTKYIETALQKFGQSGENELETEAKERDRLMEALLQKTANFQIGDQPTREEMNER
jgi:antitoxin component of RelBE/YafQ-DinJ toxin-antitoxin module